MPDFTQVYPGDSLGRLTAADWNAAMAAAKGFPTLGGLGGGPETGFGCEPAVTVLVRNDTGADLGPFVPIRLGRAVAGIDHLDLPNRNDYEASARPCFEGLAFLVSLPDGGIPAQIPAVLVEAVPAGGIGRAAVGGAAVCRVSAEVTTVGEWVGPPPAGNAALVPGGGWGPVLTPPVGTTDRACFVLLGAGRGAVPVEVSSVASGVTGWQLGRPLWPATQADGTPVATPVTAAVLVRGPFGWPLEPGGVYDARPAGATGGGVPAGRGRYEAAAAPPVTVAGGAYTLSGATSVLVATAPAVNGRRVRFSFAGSASAVVSGPGDYQCQLAAGLGTTATPVGLSAGRECGAVGGRVAPEPPTNPGTTARFTVAGVVTSPAGTPGSGSQTWRLFVGVLSSANVATVQAAISEVRAELV